MYRITREDILVSISTPVYQRGSPIVHFYFRGELRRRSRHV